MRFAPIFLVNILVSLSYAAILYVNSTFLGRFYTTSAVSILYVVGAIGNIILFLLIPELFKRASPQFWLVLFLVTGGGSVLGLLGARDALSAGFLFVLYASVIPVAWYCMDLALEALTRNSSTGNTRGIYLTLSSLAIALAPLGLTLFISGEDLRPVYLFAAALIIPAVILVLFFINKGITQLSHHKSHHLPFANWWNSKDVRGGTLTRLVLDFFYAFMVVYTPVYLHSVLGFSWQELGIMFPIMLIPFVLLEWPAGYMADKLLGEKELMSTGFFIMGLSLLVMPFLGKSLVAWATILFISRVGASLVEVMCESYFFKHVDSGDTGTISIYRLSGPTGMILGMTVGTLIWSFFPPAKIFLVLAVAVLLGLHQSLYLRDTR